VESSVAGETSCTMLDGLVIIGAQEVLIDLSFPRTVLVRGRNARTGQEKTYLLKVTQHGKLILQ